MRDGRSEEYKEDERKLRDGRTQEDKDQGTERRRKVQELRREGRGERSVLHKYHISGASSHFLRLTDECVIAARVEVNPQWIFWRMSHITRVVNEFPSVTDTASPLPLQIAIVP